MTRKLLACALLTGLVFTVSTAVEAQIDDDFPEVVLFATNSMTIDQNTTVVSGDVVVNADSPALVELTVGNKTKFPVNWEVKAHAITAGNFIDFFGTEYCNVPVGLTSCLPLSTPVYDPLPLFKAAAPGMNNVSVPNSTTVTLSPGKYGTLTGGVESTVIFESGLYDFQSITIDRKGDLLFQGDTTIRVAGAVNLGVEVDVMAAAGFTVAARQVVFYVGGNATMGPKGVTRANVYSPTGTVTLSSNIMATGAFLGKNVVVEAKAQVTLDSHFVNLPPNAVNDSATTAEDTAVVIPVLANDSDPNGDAISVASVDDPANGTATTNGTTVTYTPDLNYCNDGSPTDNFNYQVCDNSTAINGNNCSTATISVTVTCVNDPPTANNDAYNATEDTQLAVAAPGVLGNDVDVDSTLTVSASDATSAQGGAVSVAADGSFTYDPAANFCGSDSFGYTASDGEFSSSATVSIEVACVNDAPVANDDSYNATEDTPLNVAAPGVLGNDTDADGDTLSVSASDSSSANGGAVGVAADGSFSYTPAANFCGSDSFGYTASDGTATDTATVSINVACVNDAPVANDDTATTNQDTAVVIAVLANDVDVDGDTLTVSLNQAQTSSGSMTTDGTTVTYTPVANFFGEDRFSYTACDAEPLCDTAEVVVTVVDVAQPPFANAQDVVNASGVTSITLTGGDPDGEALTFDLVTAPRGTLTGLPATDNSPAFDTARSVVVTYDSGGDDSEDSFVFSVFDGTFTAQATVRINPGASDPGNEDPPPLGDVVAKDLLCDPQNPSDCPIETFQGQTKRTIRLTAAAPCDPAGAANPAQPCDGIGNDVPVTFSLPSLVTSQGGTLSNLVQGSGNPRRSATVDYLPPNSAFTGKDSFTFVAEGDVDDSGSIDQPNESDTGTVDVNVRVFAPPAPVDLGGDRSIGFRDQTPVTIDLSIPQADDVGNPHGNAASQGLATSASEGTTSGNNGADGRGGLRGAATNAALGVGQGWDDFTWSGTIPVFATDSPSGDATYNFTLSGPGCVSVTDDFDNGDQFRLYDNGQLLGSSTPVANIVTGTSVGPDNAFVDPSYSSGTFALAAGSHSITVELIGASFTIGRAYLRADDANSGVCEPSPAPNLTIVEFSAPKTVRKGACSGAPNGCYAFGKSIRVVVANTGDAASSGGSIGLYISTDKTITTGDTLLFGGRESLPALQPGQTAQIQLNGANGIPDTVAPGKVFIGAVADEFNAVTEISETDNTASQALIYQGPPVYTITSLPQGGSLSYAAFDTQTGQPTQVPITPAPFALPVIGDGSALSVVTYTPSAGTQSDSFGISLSDGLSVDTALVNLGLVASALGNCEDSEAFCDDGRGGLGPVTQGGSAAELDAKIGGPRFTVEVEGKGDVSSSRRWHDGVSYEGVVCSGGASCGANFGSASEIVLYARPTEHDSEFVEWGGDCRGTDPVTVVTVRRDTVCTAVFRTTGDQ